MQGDLFLSTLTARQAHLVESRQDVDVLADDSSSLSLLHAPLPSSAELASQLSASEANLKTLQSVLLDKRNRLTASVSELQRASEERRVRLSSLPEEIDSTEDALMGVCSAIDLDDYAQETPIAAENIRGEADKAGKSQSLARSLQSKMDQLDQLRTARDYLSLLAKAEDLQRKSLQAEKEDKQAVAFGYVAELGGLLRQVETVTSASAESAASDTLKAVTFVRAQLSQAFFQLITQRKERLSSALEQAGWPPVSSDAVLASGSDSQSRRKAEDILLADENLKRRWTDLMKLQRQGEKLRLMPASSARAAGSAINPPGSKSYQPLLAVQCLFTPLLLRFYYHFDSDRSTNRLDKPEWYLSHMLNMLRSNVNLFHPTRGPIAILCKNQSSREHFGVRFDLHSELLHAIIRPLVIKVETSIPLLLENSRLLSHTIMQIVHFDQDIREILLTTSATAPVFLAETLLAVESVFEAWVQSERDFVMEGLEEEMSSGNAWIVGEEVSSDEGQEGSWAAMAQDGSASQTAESDIGDRSDMKTTRSAREVVSIIEGLLSRYRGLPSLTHQLPFVLIQLSVLQRYAQRLERSLDSFESISSAFSRAIPGAISVGGSPGPDVSIQSESDMVRGLRGLGRLLKACLSALFVVRRLTDLASTSFFLELSMQLHASAEGQKALREFRSWQGAEEEKELDKASLGELVRRGWKSGGRLAASRTAQPEASSSRTTGLPMKSEVEDESGTSRNTDVWQNTRQRYEEIAMRAQKAMEKLVVSEVMEVCQTYARRSWDEDDDETPDHDSSRIDGFDIPTPSLHPALSIFSTHLSHLIPSLPRVNANFVYRRISNSISTALVDRVIIAGGSHRFSEQGAIQLRQDVLQGWLGVVADVARSEGNRLRDPSASAVGRNAERPWKYLLDASLLLSLPHSVEGSEESVTLHQACQASYAGLARWSDLRRKLAVDDRMDIRMIQEILKRRIDCPW